MSHAYPNHDIDNEISLLIVLPITSKLGMNIIEIHNTLFIWPQM